MSEPTSEYVQTMFPVKQTSRQVYDQILSDGSLTRLQWRVYRALYRSGPMTGSELNEHLSHASAHKRLSELRDLGTIREEGVRRCKVTNRKATAWDCAHRLPEKLPRRVRPAKPSAGARNRVACVLEGHLRGPLSFGEAHDADVRAVAEWLRG